MELLYKFKYQLIVLCAFSISLLSCQKEPAVNPIGILIIDTPEPFYAGNKMTFRMIGTNDMATLFTGDTLHDWNLYPKATGLDISQKTVVYTFTYGGAFEINCVISNYGNWGNDLKQTVLKKVINVIDNQTGLMTIKIRSTIIYGKIDNIAKTVTFKVKSTVDLSSIILEMKAISRNAQIFADGQPVVDGAVPVNLSSSTIFKVVAPTGDIAEFSVIIIIS
jgi:hypothetical protein